jgi:hypothetical protein
MSSNWLNRIQQHTVTPPEGAWDNIAGYLDNETTVLPGFATRLSAFEITAPASAEKNIFALLDAAEENASFEKRIYNHEETAPTTAWPAIVTALEKKETKIVSLETHKNNKRIVSLRAAAAVIIIAVIAVTAWLLNNRDAGTGEIAVAPQQKQEVTAPVSATTTTTLPVSEAQKDNSNAAMNSTIAEKKIPANTVIPPSAPAYIQHTEIPVLAQNPVNGKKDKLQTITGQIPEDISLISSPNSYISITGPDGQSIRVSSKFSNLISYLTEKNPEVQENLDIIIKESAQWRATFAKWRDKMTNNAVAPSLSNFMDIIELSNILEEKK